MKKYVTQICLSTTNLPVVEYECKTITEAMYFAFIQRNEINGRTYKADELEWNIYTRVGTSKDLKSLQAWGIYDEIMNPVVRIWPEQ